ncbi:MAG: Ig-like domain-containing protein [Chitinophagales bacterium]|nr:Ig-like domain-containing protein [Chitinophagales bacterium]
MKITRILSINAGAAPFTITVQGCSCTSVTESVQTLDTFGVVSIEVDFPSAACYDECDVTVLVEDADGCRSELAFNDLANPCDDLEVTISNNGYEFVATPSGGTGYYSFMWSYDKNMFNLLSKDAKQSTLKLEPKLGQVNVFSNSSVTVFVTDSKGCNTTASVPANVCPPAAYNSVEFISIPCFLRGVFDLQAQACSDRSIDWSTLDFTRVVDNASDEEVLDKLYFEPDSGSAGRGEILYNTNDQVLLTQGGSFTVYWQVADDLGIVSNEASFLVYVFPCVAPEPHDVSTNQCKCNYRAQCVEVELGRDIALEIDMSNCFEKCDCNDDAKDVDPSTFHIVSGPYIAGAYVVWNPATLKLQYFAPAGSVGIDLVEYTICNSGGQCSGISSATIFLNCIDPPTLVDDQACTNCAEPVTINVLANDSGQNINPASLQIVEQPSFGSVYIDTNYNIVYTPFVNYSGSDTFKYVVLNYAGQGGQPEPATVTITVSCAGNGQPVVLCDTEPEPMASISAGIVCDNNVNQTIFEILLGGWIDNNGSNVALVDGDLIKLQSAVLGLNVELIVGENPLLVSGYQNDVGGNWASLIPFLTVAGDMEASDLLAGTYAINFDKKDWAETNGFINIYDVDSGAQTQDQAVEIDLTAYSKDVSEGTMSSMVTATIEKVKINAFEDTSYPSYTKKPKGVGTWSSVDGAAPTVGCGGSCTDSEVESWYSQFQASCDTPLLTLPPSIVSAYKIDSGSEVVLSPGYPLTLGSGEADLILGLNSFGPWSFKYVACAVPALAPFGVKGYNGSFVVSCYMEESAEDLEFFKITYENGTDNDGLTSKMTLDSIVLF